MKVTGFTFIRNATKFDYPVVEAIKSILPVCDDFVVALGNSDDNTLDLIENIDKQKIRIIKTIWDDSPGMKKGGKVFASETNKAFKAISMDSDWAFYIQGDEVIHEKYLENIYSSMEKWKDDKMVDGLLFNYLHFYGSYDYIGISPKWYNHEIRVIKNNKAIYSFRDAQGFRKGVNEKLNVKPIDAFVYHYGWVKEPETMMRKAFNANSFYQKKRLFKKTGSKSSTGSNEFDYSSIDSLSLYTGTHPKVMEEHIRRKNWSFEHDISFNRLSLRYKSKIFIKKYLGINTYYENYKVL
jgi:hypothetical protein